MGADSPWELYDLETDRTGMHNLIDSFPEKARVLTDAWETWTIRARVEPFPETINK